MRDVKQALKDHKQRVIDAGYLEEQILGIFVYGSQNYGLATENSDVDTKCVLIPTINELIYHPIATKTLVLPNEEHCEVMDIKHLVQNFRKQNINFVEILFTDLCWVNPKYEQLWKMFFLSQKEAIAHYDPEKCFKSICGQAIHTLRQNPLDGKKVGNARRLQYFLTWYGNGDSYETCIIPNEKVKQEILNMKYKTLDSCEKAEELEKWFKTISELIVKPTDEVNPERVDYFMELGTLKMVEKCQYGHIM